MSEFLSVKVVRKEHAAAGVYVFELVSVSGELLPEFTAGSHIDVHVSDAICRQYSLCNDPAERHRYVIGVLNEPQSRGGSKAMHERIQEGDILEIGQPRNLFALEAPAQRAMLFGGGIGITPILCMAEHLCSIQTDFHMHYSGRSLERMAFVDHIVGGRLAPFVSIHADDGTPEQRLDIAQALSRATKDTHLYVCGPAGFIVAVTGEAKRAGWPSTHIHVEHFTAEPVSHEGDAGFEVKLARSGISVRVAADETVVEALARDGIAIDTSCEQGICGTCLTGVLEGHPDHRDMYLSESERLAGNVFLPCCSRSHSAILVLDL